MVSENMDFLKVKFLLKKKEYNIYVYVYVCLFYFSFISNLNRNSRKSF